MNRIKLKIWGRDISLKVIYQYYEDKQILEIQKLAYNEFISKANILLADNKQIIDYCFKHNKDDIADNNIENIFEYVKPIALYIARKKDKRVVAIMCDYKFDEEHGLAIVFENERFKFIDEEDAIL